MWIMVSILTKVQIIFCNDIIKIMTIGYFIEDVFVGDIDISRFFYVGCMRNLPIHCSNDFY